MKGSFKTMDAKSRMINRNLIGVPEKQPRREKAILKKTKAKNFQELIYRHEGTNSRNTTYFKQDK